MPDYVAVMSEGFGAVKLKTVLRLLRYIWRETLSRRLIYWLNRTQWQMWQSWILLFKTKRCLQITRSLVTFIWGFFILTWMCIMIMLRTWFDNKFLRGVRMSMVFMCCLRFLWFVMMIVRMMKMRFFFLLLMAMIMVVLVLLFSMMVMMTMRLTLSLFLIFSLLNRIHLINFIHDFLICLLNAIHCFDHIWFAPINIKEVDHIVNPIISAHSKIIVKPFFTFFLLFSPQHLWFKFQAFFEKRKIIEVILFLVYWTGLFCDVSSWTESCSHAILRSSWLGCLLILDF